ncbi:50S ribosomal protein L4 [bacterium CG10_37_50]|nr:MAG: 50S ribosomal protein L4 [bacterium CG10_37_50]
MDTAVYNQKGQSTGTIKLEPKLFGLKWKADMVHQVIFSMLSNARAVLAHTKGRDEVQGGGKKPWRQKGTGRARHGSSRSPIWKGGGVTHGPTKEVNFHKKINKKMKTNALFTILSRKFKDGEILFMDSLKLDGKTKTGQSLLAELSKLAGYEKINYARGARLLIATATKDELVEKTFANIKTVSVTEVRNLNPLESITYKYILLTEPIEIQSQLMTRLK